MIQRNLWTLARQLGPPGGSASHLQIDAVRYWLGDVPEDATISHNLAHRLLSIRTYLVGLLDRIERTDRLLHPREASEVLLDRLVDRNDIVNDLRKWSRQRYTADYGVPRIGATKHVLELTNTLLPRCKQQPPTLDEQRAAFAKALARSNLSALIADRPVSITYRSHNEITTRVISDIQLDLHWPFWSIFLIDPVGPATRINAFCHLRRDRRTFVIGRISEAV